MRSLSYEEPIKALDQTTVLNARIIGNLEPRRVLYQIRILSRLLLTKLKIKNQNSLKNFNRKKKVFILLNTSTVCDLNH